MNTDKILFEEKQYLGYNTFSIIRRMFLSLFCFMGYYWSQNPKAVTVSGIRIGSYPVEHIPNSGELFFLLGLSILVLSVVMIFVLHLHTQVTETSIILIGLWTKRMVKINIADLRSVETVHYKSLLFKQSSYNLHFKGNIRFYTSGHDAVQLKDKDGLIYRIGTQRAGELKALIEDLLNRKM